MPMPDWTAVSAIATILLAAGTFGVIWEARAARIEAARRTREVVFRATLVELATNIEVLESWDPLQQSDPPQGWPQAPLAFVAMKDLLAHVWLPGALWDRVTTLMTNLRAYMEVMLAQIHSLPADSATRGEYVPQRENIKELYYIIDLYLKQLASYLIAEMARQHLDLPRDWRDGRPLFAPLPWRYNTRFSSLTATAYVLETGPAWRPFTPQAPEPEDPAYAHCRLERLMKQAQQRAEAADAQLHAMFVNTDPTAGIPS